MADWECIAGSTLLLPSGSQGNHLFVVLNDPADVEGHPPQSCVAVCFCTVRGAFYDKTCILEAGAHPFIKEQSYVAYRHARTDTAEHLTKLIARGTFYAKEPVEQDLLKRIRDGFLQSSQTSNALKKLGKVLW